MLLLVAGQPWLQLLLLLLVTGQAWLLRLVACKARLPVACQSRLLVGRVIGVIVSHGDSRASYPDLQCPPGSQVKSVLQG